MQRYWAMKHPHRHISPAEMAERFKFEFHVGIAAGEALQQPMPPEEQDANVSCRVELSVSRHYELPGSRYMSCRCVAGCRSGKATLCAFGRPNFPRVPGPGAPAGGAQHAAKYHPLCSAAAARIYDRHALPAHPHAPDLRRRRQPVLWR